METRYTVFVILFQLQRDKDYYQLHLRYNLLQLTLAEPSPLQVAPLVSTELQHDLPLLPHGYPEATGVVPIFKDVAGPLGGLLGRPGHLHYEQPNTVILLGSWCWQEGPRRRLMLLGKVTPLINNKSNSSHHENTSTSQV